MTNVLAQPDHELCALVHIGSTPDGYIVTR